MTHICRAIVLAGCFVVTSVGVSAVADGRSTDIERAVEEYDEQAGEARDSLLENFDTALGRLSSRTQGLDVDERLKLIEVVSEEKERFETQGLIPWSLPMRSYLAAHQRRISVAETRLRRVYQLAIKRALRADDQDQVSQLQADLNAVLQPQVVAVWQHRFGRGPRRTLLYSNGRINAADSADTWSFRDGILTLVWVAPPWCLAGRVPRLGGWLDVLREESAGAPDRGKLRPGAVRDCPEVCCHFSVQ
jgi:hypothetical protein